MELSEYCFCGCGEPRSKLDAANIEGFTVTFELAQWLNYLSIMKRAGRDSDWSSAENFVEDGTHCYRLYVNEVHHGENMSRKEKKLARRWKKFSLKTREGIGRDVVEPGDPNPFDGDMPHPRQIREWVYEGTLLPID